MFTLAFWKAAAERAVKTFAQSLVAILVAAYGLTDVDWSTSLSVAGLATLVSLLTSVASSKVGGDGPSVVDAEVLSPPAPNPEDQRATGYASGV